MCRFDTLFLLSLSLLLLLLPPPSSCDFYCGQRQGGFTTPCAFPYPRQYIAYYTSTPPKIDGLLDEELWKEVIWTESFADISGYAYPTPRFATHAKIRWDVDWLYVGAEMEEPQAWANLTQRNSIIYFDNDFEIFVDPAGSTHYYKEWEMNGNNAVWDLCLNQPYLNGGYENSSRVFANGFDMTSARSAVYVQGILNDPYVGSSRWSVEVALPIDMLMVNQSSLYRPSGGTYWRINFSRVEWNVTVVNNEYQKVPNDVEDNWVWEPIGVIDIHLPERWGVLQFSDGPVNETELIRDPSWAVRYVAFQVYYSECSYFNRVKMYTDNVHELELEQVGSRQPHTLDGTCTYTPNITLSNQRKSFSAIVASLDGCFQATIDDTRYLTVEEFCIDSSQDVTQQRKK